VPRAEDDTDAAFAELAEHVVRADARGETWCEFALRAGRRDEAMTHVGELQKPASQRLTFEPWPEEFRARFRRREWRPSPPRGYPTCVNAGSDAALFEQAAETLVRAEERINLLGRVAPADVFGETVKLRRAYASGKPLVVTHAGEVSELAPVRHALAHVQRATEPLGPIGRLYAERAGELELEARLVEALGTPRFRVLAADRFPEPPLELARACDAFVAEAEGLEPPEPAERYRSDDEAEPRSLISRLRLKMRELGLAFTVRVARSQLAAAATGAGLVSVRAGMRLTAAAGERITAHELLGHALPRARARHASPPLLCAGTRGAADDEEGRALLVERRANLLDAERRRELALRHVAASGVRRGAELRDTVDSLVARGAPLERALELALRIHRGGGLAREIVYLPAYFAVARAFSEEPSLERWFERGRIGLAAARELNAALPTPGHDRTVAAAGAVPRRSPLA
jgi:hypothetical protein